MSEKMIVDEISKLKKDLHELRLDTIKMETRLIGWIYGAVAFVMLASTTIAATIFYGGH